MADKNLIQQMLEHLVNDDQAKAEELFHEYVVSASREIYESLIEAEIEDEDEEVEEATDDEDKEDEKVEENFEDIAIEGDDEEGADATDDLLGDVEVDSDEEGEGGEEGPESLEDKVMDLEDAVEELEAKFAELAGEEAEEPEHADMFGGEEGGEEEDEVVDSFDQELATVREYVEKVAGGHGAEKKGAGEAAGANTKTPVAGKNDMGGTTANILKGGEGGGSDKGLLGKGTKDLGVNDPKAAAKGAFKSKVASGHGAEKKGAGESSVNSTSLFRK